jgi:hypothetical protein
MAVTTPAVPATTIVAPNTTGDQVDVALTGGTVTGVLVTPPVSPVIATPAIPATTVQQVNNNPFPVAVTITGGTVTVVAVNGTTVFTATGVTAVVPAGGNIAITYSVVPTSWVWTPLYAGAAASGGVSGASYPVPPGGGISMIYSAAPTWAWTNPPNFDEINYAAANTVDNNELTWPWQIAHEEAGQTGLGEGVSN